MPELKAGHIDPTEEEEVEIQRQIAEDPDDSAHWKDNTSARPAIAMDPELVEWSRRSRTPLHNSSDDSR